MRRLINRLPMAICLIILFSLVLVGVSFALTPAGTKIYNKAIATYQYHSQDYTVESNQVQTEVLPVYGLSITPNGTTAAPGQEQIATPNTTVYFPYTLTNTGNADDTYDLTTSVNGSSTFNPNNITIYFDENGNGVVDPGESSITNTGTVHADESIQLIVAYDVPATALADQFTLVNLIGTSTHDGTKIDNDNWNKTTVVSDAVLTISKSASPSSVDPGDTITYTVSGGNTGNTATTVRTFDNIDTDGDGSVDAGQNGLLVKDIIPADTHITGTPATDFGTAAPAGATPLYGYNNGNWSTSGTVAGWGTIDKVGLFISGTLAAGQSYSFKWHAVVDSDAPAGNIPNQATIDWANTASDQDDSPSNTTLTMINAIAGLLIGPYGDAAGTTTGSYLSPDTVNGPFTINYTNDISTADFVTCGSNHFQNILFINTIKNTGTSPDIFNITTSWSANEIQGSAVRLFKSDGLTPLIDSNGDGINDIGEIEPGADYNIVVKIFIPENVSCDILDHDLTITAISVNDKTKEDTTIDRIRFGADIWDPLKKEVSPSGDVPPGATLHYTNTFGNAGGITATDVVIEDVLDVHLINPKNVTGLPETTISDLSGINSPISVTATYTPDVPAGSGGTITWIFPSIPPGFIGQVSFDVTISPTTPDGTVINNKFSITGPGLPVAISSVTLNTVVSKNILIVEKYANKDEVEIGDFLQYTIIVKNISKTMTISSPVEIVDTLPRGFRYVSDSSKLDGNPFPNPNISSDGRVLTWDDIGSIPPNSQKKLTFVALVTVDADMGDGINTVSATGYSCSGTPIDSNEAQEEVEVKKGLFRDCQTIIGKIFIDDNDNKIQDEGEIGVPGIRLYLEDGTFTVTDSEGKYHFECVKPGTHVIKLDRISLPEGMEIDGVNNRTRGSVNLQFVDLKKGGLFKANFRIEPKGIEKEVFRVVVIPRYEKSAQLKIEMREIKLILYFLTDSNELSPASKTTIDDLFKFIKDIEQMGVSVEGHADIRKTRSWRGGNKELSLVRAEGVAYYLESKYHLKGDKIAIKGYGAESQLVSTDILTDESLQPNQHVEFSTNIPIIAEVSAQSEEVFGQRVTVRIARVMDGPMQRNFLVIPVAEGIEIERDSIKINGSYSSELIKFGNFWWIRLKDLDQDFDGKSFNLNRQKIKLSEYDQSEIVEVGYSISGEKIPLHFIIGIDERGEVKVFAENIPQEKEQEEEIVKLKKNIEGFYITMNPDLSKKGATEISVSEKEYGILSPEDKAVFLTRDKISIRVKFPLDSQADELRVNDVLINKEKVGKKILNRKDNTAIFEYVNVPIYPGKNKIEFISKDQKGEEQKTSITVFLHKEPVKIEVKTIPYQLPADGKTEPDILIKPLDENDLPLPEGTFITLEIDEGRFITPDANPKQEGYQAGIKEGIATVRISAAHKVEKRILKILAGNFKETKTLEFLPYLRDWIVVGIAEGTVGYNEIKENIRGEKTDDKEGLFEDGRLAFFLKGTVLGKYLLTISYDTDKTKEKGRLFQQVEPDKYYPVYGDSSIERYDAESSAKLYIRLERDKSYIMYGDYKTEFTDTETAKYDRTFTGGKGNLETKLLDLKGFWTRTDQIMVKDEIRGDGTSGYYYLTHGDIVENSEKVRIEVRDRHDLSTVLSSYDMSRYSDYWIDYYRGTILFKEPIRSVDADLNPIYIVVLYETIEEGAEEEEIYGGRAKLKLFNDTLTLGSTAILEENSIHDNKLYGVDLLVKPNKNIEAWAEITRSDVYDKEDLSIKKGESKTVSIKADYGKDLKLEAKYQETDKDFRNPNMSSFSGGVREYSLKGESEYFKDTKLKLDASKKESLLTDEKVQTVGLEGRYKPTKELEYILGERYVNIHTSSVDQEAYLLKAGVIASLTEKLNASVIREQVISGDRLDSESFTSGGSLFDTFTSVGSIASSGNLGTENNILGGGYSDRTVVGLEYQLNEFTKLRAAREWLSGEDFDLHQTFFGATSQLTKNISVFGNYGIEDAVDNPRNLANIGINSKFDITDKFSISLGLERLETITGKEDDDFTALTSSFSYLPDLYKLTGRYELRYGKEDVKHLFELNTVTRMNTDYTFFIRERLSYVDNNDKADEYLNELLTGLAYRPVRYDKFNFLSKLKLISGNMSSDDEDMKMICSLEGNYQVSQPLTLSGKYALKWQKETFDADSYSSFTDLIEARALYDITKSWDFGIHGGKLHQYDTSVDGYYMGIETGYQIVKDLWLSVGYNFKGLEDEDFSDNNYRTEGPYINLKFKF